MYNGSFRKQAFSLGLYPTAGLSALAATWLLGKAVSGDLSRYGRTAAQGAGGMAQDLAQGVGALAAGASGGAAAYALSGYVPTLKDSIPARLLLAAAAGVGSGLYMDRKMNEARS